MSKDNPSLDDLGLDGPALAKVACPSCLRSIQYPLNRSGTAAKCPGCKNEFTLPSVAPVSTSNEVIAASKPTADYAKRYAQSQLPKKRLRINVVFWAVLAFIGVPFIFVLFVCAGFKPSANQATADEVMTELLQQVNSDTGVAVFGKSKCNGRVATIYVEQGFDRLGELEKRLALETVHRLWVEGASGTKSIFKSWDGKIVAELEK